MSSGPKIVPFLQKKDIGKLESVLFGTKLEHFQQEDLMALILAETQASFWFPQASFWENEQ